MGGGGSGRAAESRARVRGGGGGCAERGMRAGCCAGAAQINISRYRGDRARLSASRTTPAYPHTTLSYPHLPTTRLFNTCRIWDASFFVLNDRAA